MKDKRTELADRLLQKIKEHDVEGLKKNKAAIISDIVHGKLTAGEQMLLRSELQKRLIEGIEKKDRMMTELQSTEEDIKQQCRVTSHVAKKLVESDGKLSRIKRGQEKITDEMAKAHAAVQKKKRNEAKEDLMLIGVLGIFLSVCVYVVIDRVVLRKLAE